MKKFILWLAKVFNVVLPQVVDKDRKCEFQNFNGQVVEGDLLVSGELTVLGNLKVSKGIMMYAEGKIEFEKDGCKRSYI